MRGELKFHIELPAQKTESNIISMLNETGTEHD